MQEPRQATRKLAAIMFTDMVGYSALAQKNETLALELLEEHRGLLRSLFPKFGGQEVETAGDSFFVEFPSALDAARCAIEIQTSLRERNAQSAPERQILLRIGLHLGDVVHYDKYVHGDGVNIAARIEPCAVPGGICLSQDFARQIENKIELRLVRLGKGELKNIQLPVTIYRMVMPWERKSLGLLDAARFVLKRVTKRVAYLALAAIALAVALIFVPPVLFPPAYEPNSIAVLPFKNFSEDQGAEYFTDGLTDEVIGQLSKIRALRVTSRTSVMQYKNKDKSVRDIGRELNVAHILEGSVRKDGSRVRILAQLINAEDDRHLWTEQYDGALTDIFSIQADIATKIAAALETKISSAEQERLNTPPTANLEAYDLYLKGRYFWNERLPDKVEKGIEYFKAAIVKDSTFALPYAGLADAYTLLGNFNVLPPQQVYPEAKKAALKALTLDSMLAQAHAALGVAFMSYEWDWTSAERELQRAIEIDPNYVAARTWYAYLLTVLGRSTEAERVRQKAVELDPLSPLVHADIGLSLYLARRYDEAIKHFTQALTLDPTFILTNIPLGAAYVQQKMFNEAIAAIQQLTSGLNLTSVQHPVPIAVLGHAYAAAGRKADAQMLEKLLDSMAMKQYVPPYWRAAAAIGLGKKDEALTWLEKAFTDRDGSMMLLKVDPVFDQLRSDPRFVSLLKRMGLSE
jgi:TolB-like protein/class 3 adenylate cyclase/Tfp pilus assembly protein PilF